MPRSAQGEQSTRNPLRFITWISITECQAGIPPLEPRTSIYQRPGVTIHVVGNHVVCALVKMIELALSRICKTHRFYWVPQFVAAGLTGFRSSLSD